MALSFLSSQELQVASGIMDQLHATFARQLVVFKTSQQIQISSNPNFNFAFPPGPNDLSIQEIPVSGIINARVQYGDHQQLERLFATSNRGHGGDDELRLDLPKGIVRIKFEAGDFPFFIDAKKIILDGESFVPYSDLRPHGPVNLPQHYTIYLQKTE